MASNVLRFALLLLTSLLVGTMFGIWIGIEPSALSAATYAWWHWHIVRTIAGIAALSLLLFDALGSRRSPLEAG